MIPARSSVSSGDSAWTIVRDHVLGHFLGLGTLFAAPLVWPVSIWTDCTWWVVLTIGILAAWIGAIAREAIQQAKANTPDFWKMDTLWDIIAITSGGLTHGLLAGLLV